MGKDWCGIQIMIATKNKPKTDRLGGLARARPQQNGSRHTRRRRAYRGRIKRHAGVSGPYAGTVEESGRDLNAVTGPANFHRVWDEIGDGRFKISRVGAPRRRHLSRHSNHPRQRATPAGLHPARRPVTGPRQGRLPVLSLGWRPDSVNPDAPIWRRDGAIPPSAQFLSE